MTWNSVCMYYLVIAIDATAIISLLLFTTRAQHCVLEESYEVCEQVYNEDVDKSHGI